MVTRMVPHRLTSDTCLYVSMVVNSTSPNMETPALFTTAHRPAAQQDSAHLVMKQTRCCTVAKYILKKKKTKIPEQNKYIKNETLADINIQTDSVV